MYGPFTIIYLRLLDVNSKFVYIIIPYIDPMTKDFPPLKRNEGESLRSDNLEKTLIVNRDPVKGLYII